MTIFVNRSIVPIFYLQVSDFKVEYSVSWKKKNNFGKIAIMARVCRVGDFIEGGSKVARCNALHLELRCKEAHGENGFRVLGVIPETCRTIRVNKICPRGLKLEPGGMCREGDSIIIDTCPARISVSDPRKREASTVLVVDSENCRSVRAGIPALCPRKLGPNQE